MTVGIVLGYGLFDQANQEYTSYLNWIIADAKTNRVEKLILCGGRTNKEQPAVSEAQTMAEYLQKVAPDFSTIDLEDQSLTTNQNLAFAATKINSTDQIIVYCDLIRVAKVIWLSAYYLLKKERQEIFTALFEFVADRQLKPFKFWNLTIKGFDFPSRDRNQAIEQSFSALLEVEATSDPTLEEKILANRRQYFAVNP